MPQLTHVVAESLELTGPTSMPVPGSNPAATLGECGTKASSYGSLKHLSLAVCYVNTLAHLPLSSASDIGDGIRTLTINELTVSGSSGDDSSDSEVDEAESEESEGDDAEAGRDCVAALANLARCYKETPDDGMWGPCVRVGGDGGVLRLNAESGREFAALLTVVPYVAGVTVIQVVASYLSAAHIEALATAPDLPEAITMLDLTQCTMSDFDGLSCLLPAITNSPGLSDVVEVMLPATWPPTYLMTACCASHGQIVARPIFCWLRTCVEAAIAVLATRQSIQQAVEAAGLSGLVSVALDVTDD
jgi:hypothetical protein